jgi:micrococcal nuclease
MLLRLLQILFGPTPRRQRASFNAPRQQQVQADVISTSVVSIETSSIEVAVVEAPVTAGRCSVIDGDTIVIQGRSIRLAGVDAPELQHPWGQKAKWELVGLTKGLNVTAAVLPELSYDRVVAVCTLPDGRDLAAEMVKAGLALDWEKFSGGKYRHLEPEGVRKKLWRCAAKHDGKFF